MVIRDTKVTPFKHNNFPIVPIYAYMEDSGKKVETFGVVKNLIDPQDEKNKRHSQFIDILNRAPKGGGFFQQSAIDGEQLKSLSTPVLGSELKVVLRIRYCHLHIILWEYYLIISGSKRRHKKTLRK